MAPHSSTLAWKIPWMEEPGRLQPMGSLRVWHDWATSLSFFTFMHCRRKWNPLQCSCLENPRDGRDWWAAVFGAAQSRTRLKWLSSKSEITDTMDMGKGGLWELLMDREAWHAVVHRVTKSQTWLSDWTELTVKCLLPMFYSILKRAYKINTIK